MQRILQFFIRTPETFFLIGTSFLTRFWNLAFPNSVVFDEAHFGLYATKYLSHLYYFDMHPPLGKMILGFFAWVAHAKPGFDFTAGASYGDFPFLALRLAPAIFGFLLVPLVYFFVRALGFSRKSAFLAGFFVLFDNALLLESRLILLNIFLVFFVFLALLFFVLLRKTTRYSAKWYFLAFFCGLAIGLAMSVKLIGFGVLGVVWAWMIIQKNLLREPKKYILSQFLFLLALPFLLYGLIMASHFLLVSNQCTENCGSVLLKNVAFSTNVFLESNTPPSGNFLEKFFQMNKKIFYSNAGGSGSSKFYYESKWYSWPFMIRPVLYGMYPQGDKTSYLYLIGNPSVWWLSSFGVLGAFYIIFRHFFYRSFKKIPQILLSQSSQFLFLGYIIFFFSFMALERFLLPYHYFAALIFAIIIFSVFADSLLSRLPNAQANIIYGGILLLAFLSFLYFAPLTYGIPLTESQFHARMWLPTWGF